MRLKLLITLLIASTMLAILGLPRIEHKVGLTNEEVKEIYNNLVKFVGEPGAIPKLVISESGEINAWITQDSITITRGMMNFVKSSDEMAVIVGHEMGHWALQHFELSGDGRLHEANADKFAIYLMHRAGYDVCQARNVWDRLADRFGDKVTTNSHPDFAYRSWQLQFPACK